MRMQHYYRVRVPCRRILMKWLHIDRYSTLKEQLQSMIIGESFLLFLMQNAISHRWKSRNMRIRQIITSEGSTGIRWLAGCRSIRPKNFIRSASQWAAKLSRYVTKTSENRCAMASIHLFVQNLYKISRESGWDPERIFQNALDLTFRSTFADLDDDRKYFAGGNRSSSYSKEVIIGDYKHDGIQGPPKRANMRNAASANKISYKTRLSRKARSITSKYVPLISVPS